MRKLFYTAAAAAALAIASSANAAVTVTGSTGLNNPDPSAVGSVQTVGTTTTINFGQNPVADGFSASFIVHNTLAGLYSIVLSTSDPNTFFDSASFAGVALSPFPDNQNLRLIPPQNLAVGDYTFNLTGHTTVAGGSFTGNVTINPVPEPATWAMMLVGFAGIGLTIRRRRKPVLAQLA